MSDMKTFRNRTDPSEVVSALRFVGNFDEIEEFVGGDAEFRAGRLVVASRQGALHASSGEWIVKMPDKTFRVLSPEFFAATYDLVASESPTAGRPAGE